ncbi:very short patch repair endonuclease [Micromonospora sp. WMMD882]|uniref:very short patch repair endonuclease n=1 Tax=Micromonospora sp. WMMD882 TaxID=3015151 RepID=UPI00248CF6FC|nr:very short patch repair endonuclease [Micromonospora sp. WMMD882]WBB82409.1 very short patch repair endonuclease [Micromonospora sp. WMMD882]
MKRQRRRDTSPELAVRQELHRAGLRYRIHVPVPGMVRRTMDICFPKARLSIFIDGCYWHGCPDHGTMPKSNSQWWAHKLARNQERDAETSAHLKSLGWTVMRFWSHESPDRVAEVVGAHVRGEHALTQSERSSLKAGSPVGPEVTSALRGQAW